MGPLISVSDFLGIIGEYAHQQSTKSLSLCMCSTISRAFSDVQILWEREGEIHAYSVGGASLLEQFTPTPKLFKLVTPKPDLLTTCFNLSVHYWYHMQPELPSALHWPCKSWLSHRFIYYGIKIVSSNYHSQQMLSSCVPSSASLPAW